MTVSNRLSRIHSVSSILRTRIGVHDRCRADHGEQPAAGAQRALEARIVHGHRPVTAITSNSPKRRAIERVPRLERHARLGNRLEIRGGLRRQSAWISIEWVAPPRRLMAALK